MNHIIPICYTRALMGTNLRPAFVSNMLLVGENIREKKLRDDLTSGHKFVTATNFVKQIHFVKINYS